MPASKETRVRVEDFSKIIASSFPLSGVCRVPCFSFCLTSIACAINARSSSPLKSSKLKKWRVDIYLLRELVDAGDQLVGNLAGLRFAED